MNRRTALSAMAALGTSALAGCATLGRAIERKRADHPSALERNKNGNFDEDASNENFDVTKPGGALTAVQVPAATAGHEYPVAGPADAPTVTFFGSWKCPYTKEFVNQNLDQIVENYVQPGSIQLEFRALAYLNGNGFLGPDDPRAGWAGQAVWANAPDHFWTYLATVFANQPPERFHWATLDRLLEMVRVADVPGEQAIADDIHSGARDDRLQKTTDAFGRLQLVDVPRLVYEGTVVAPNLEPDRTRRLLDRVAKG